MTEIVNISTGLVDAPQTAAHMLNLAIAGRILALRKARRFSLDQLAARSDVSKGMLVQIEQGRANPSIAILCRVAAGLGVSVVELVQTEAEPMSPVRIAQPELARRLWTGPHGGDASLVVGSNGPDMLELWNWTLHPGERFEAQPHPAGTQELIQVAEGSLSLEVDGVSYLVSQGASAHALTDRPHAYACAGTTPTRFTMVVHEPHPAQALPPNRNRVS